MVYHVLLPGDLHNPDIEFVSPAPLELAGGFFTTEPQGKPLCNSVIKNPLANAGDIGDAGSIPGSERFPGKEMATHFTILAWEIPLERGA